MTGLEGKMAFAGLMGPEGMTKFVGMINIQKRRSI